MLSTSSPDLLCLAARQVGKSTATAAMALSVALSKPGSLSLITTPSERQSRELLRRCVQFYRALGRPVPADTEGKIELELTNGSRILALPANESTTKGLANVALLIVDEAAYLNENIYLSLLPALAADGRRVVLSTPWVKGSWLHREWEEGSDWERIKVTVYDSPRYTPERIAKAKRTTPPLWWKTQYLCEWTEVGGSYFDYDSIMRAGSDDIELLYPEEEETEEEWETLIS